jgi:hypothetical protein
MEDINNEAPRRRGRPPMAPQEAEVAVPRAEMRPEMREEDPRARAARRAAELRGHLGDIDEGTDEFYVDPNSIPDGWTYEWKVKKVLGMEDPSAWTQIERTGWEPVPLSRHPHMMPSGWEGSIIERKGTVLMERPSEITEEMKSIDARRARDQVRAKEAQLSGTPEGGLGHRDHASVQPKISKGYAPISVPSDK